MDNREFLLKCIEMISVPLKKNIVEDGTIKESADKNPGIHELLIEVPVVWLENMSDRISINEMDRISTKEKEILIGIIVFLEDSNLIDNSDIIIQYIKENG